MHALVLLTAIASTGGLFGHKPAKTAWVQYGNQAVYQQAGCATGNCPRVQAAAPVTYVPAQAPVTQQPALIYTRPTYYTVGTTCATGNCPRR
jgi:hypothetical protein